VQAHLLELLPDRYVPGPWLYFSAEHGVQWCQPDGLIIDLKGGKIVIVEMKYQHTTDAWWQMRHLYLPVLRHIFPEALWDFKLLEVVKWYDGMLQWPEPTRLVAHPLDALTIPGTSTGIHIWKP
jgi:hypothetical protein